MWQRRTLRAHPRDPTRPLDLFGALGRWLSLREVQGVAPAGHVAEPAQISHSGIPGVHVIPPHRSHTWLEAVSCSPLRVLHPLSGLRAKQCSSHQPEHSRVTQCHSNTFASFWSETEDDLVACVVGESGEACSGPKQVWPASPDTIQPGTDNKGVLWIILCQ